MTGTRYLSTRPLVVFPVRDRETGRIIDWRAACRQHSRILVKCETQLAAFQCAIGHCRTHLALDAQLGRAAYSPPQHNHRIYRQCPAKGCRWPWLDDPPLPAEAQRPVSQEGIVS